MVTIIRENPSPYISVIIPSFDGSRGGNVLKLIDDLERQTFQNFEIIIVKGVKPNGKARNEGVKKAKGEIFIFIDDDVRLGGEKVIDCLLRPLMDDEQIGMTGPSQLIPDNSNNFQKKYARQLARAYFPVVEKITETDMVTHMCLAIPRNVFMEVGQESEVLIRGTDPDLRYRVRQAGYKIIVVPHTWAYHPAIENYRQLIKIGLKNGIGAAWVFKNYPDKVYEAPSGYVRNFKGKRSFIYRWVRRLFDLILSLLTFKFIRFTYDLFYLTGYVYGLFLSNEKIEKYVF